MENVNEDLFLPEDIQTEIEKKVKELKDSDPKLKRVFPIFVEGDEDEGQMGGWFVMSAMGLFEMDGGVTADSELDITSPLFNKITIALDSRYYPGKEFVIEAVNNSPENRYIRSARLNGKLLKNFRIPFSALVNGGRLELEMGNEPL